MNSFVPPLFYMCVRPLELCGLGCTWERNDVADVLHAGNEEDETLEAEAEACVRTTAVLAGVEVPPKVRQVHASAVNFLHQLVVTFLTDAAADNLAD